MGVSAKIQTGLDDMRQTLVERVSCSKNDTSARQAASRFALFFRGRPGFWGPQSLVIFIGSGRRSVTLPHCRHWMYLPQRSSIRCVSPLHRGQALKWTIYLHPQAGVRSSRDDPPVTEWHRILGSEGLLVKLNVLECIERVASQIFD